MRDLHIKIPKIAVIQQKHKKSRINKNKILLHKQPIPNVTPNIFRPNRKILLRRIRHIPLQRRQKQNIFSEGIKWTST